MVFAVGLLFVTAVAPASVVVTQPMLTSMAAGTAKVAGGTAAGLITSATGTGVGIATTGATTAGTIAVKVSAGVTGTLVAGVNLAMGPPGWIALGKSEYSWTCWKKLIHDESDSDEGVPLSYITNHEKVKSISNYEDHHIIENIWGEKFKIYYVILPNGDIAAHAEYF